MNIKSVLICFALTCYGAFSIFSFGFFLIEIVYFLITGEMRSAFFKISTFRDIFNDIYYSRHSIPILTIGAIALFFGIYILTRLLFEILYTLIPSGLY